MLELINGKYKTISIVGMSKNSGKTVALNHLIGEAIDEGLSIGITSIGRDGESLDIVTETEKPRIFVEEGTLIATATGMLDLGDANIEIISVTEYRTPLGEIIIGRVRDGGYVQIAGPQRLSEIKAVSDIMLNLGAKFVIIDGALDRLSQAAPAISEATILSTGAVLSRDVNKVIEETIHVVNTLGLPAIEDHDVREITRNIINENQIAVINENNQVDIIPLKTALNGGAIIGDHLRDDSKYLVIPGSLVKNTLEDLTRSTRRYKNIEIVITDGTKIFINPKDWLKFMRQGVKVKVLDKINLVGITVNPYAPQGYYFEPAEFLFKMQSYIKNIPVMDLILGGE
ncbi:hypothetical protein [Tissierella sp. P1]|uniref:lysine 5,6-aminomutase reactivase subunit KamB n=1 Tax=Tissierella sp. P1 TaxID=1280483 RepID=UPI001F20A625|nr:hypothetical protein [Tissierella sp. P1]